MYVWKAGPVARYTVLFCVICLFYGLMSMSACSNTPVAVEGGLEFCNKDGDCPKDYTCLLNICQKKKACQPAPETCNGKDDDCDGKIDEDNPGGDKDCVVSGQKGICRDGKTECKAGKVSCRQLSKPVKEICGNGRDDDCDGTIDKGSECACPKPGATQACWTKPAALRNKGVCKDGKQTCQPNQKWGPCVGEIPPAKEICDGQDNDCNGKVDDNNPGGGSPCVVPNQQGPCAKGVSACTGGKVVCKQQVQPKKDEVCGNGIDDNCNGSTDETPPCKCKSGSSRPCYTKPIGCKSDGKNPPKFTCSGICKAGKQTCSAQQEWGPCEGMKEPSKEVCDGADNNCDGKVDENNPGGGTPCVVSGKQGPCAKGINTCKSGKVICQQIVKPKAKEICGNGIDDNCDGKVDESPPCTCKPGLTRPCYDKPIGCKSDGNNPPKFTCTGQCKAGTQVCSPNQTWGNCLGAVTPGSTEFCDGKDNDCNGIIDEKVAGTGQPCFVANKSGECQRGLLVCKNVKIVCEQSVQPTKEICDNKDNDCNGKTDDNVSRTCTISASCSGTQVCSSGTWGSCKASSSTKEICDNKDNDCDGKIDNGVTRTCTLGVCTGSQTCTAGKWSACAASGGAAEVCDGKDNDCDGQVDNVKGSSTAISQSCYPTSTKGCTGSSGKYTCVGACKAGTQTCASGKWGACTGAVTPKTETKNSIDDDCDGTVDNLASNGCATGAKLGQTWSSSMVGCDCSGATCSSGALVSPSKSKALCDATAGWKPCNWSQWRFRFSKTTSTAYRWIAGAKLICKPNVSSCSTKAPIPGISVDNGDICQLESTCIFGGGKNNRYYALMVGPTVYDDCSGWSSWQKMKDDGNVGRGKNIYGKVDDQPGCLNTVDRAVGVLCCK